MKQYLRTLKVGNEIWAVVEEVIARGECVINFRGDLVRVQNATQQKLRAGQRVLLRVQGLFPLRLQLVEQTARAARHRSHFDISI